MERTPGQDVYDSPFDDIVGTHFLEVSATRVVATIALAGDRHMQPTGVVHGGVYTTVVESVASRGATAWLGGDGYALGVSNHTDFLRATGSGTLRFEGTPLQQGRTMQVWQVDVTDDEGRRVAHGKVRLFNRRAHTA